MHNIEILIPNFCRVLNVVCFLLDDSPASEIYMPMFWNRQSVPKHRHINFRHPGIIQKKAYNNIQIAKHIIISIKDNQRRNNKNEPYKQ